MMTVLHGCPIPEGSEAPSVSTWKHSPVHRSCTFLMNRPYSPLPALSSPGHFSHSSPGCSLYHFMKASDGLGVGTTLVCSCLPLIVHSCCREVYASDCPQSTPSCKLQRRLGFLLILKVGAECCSCHKDQRLGSGSGEPPSIQ